MGVESLVELQARIRATPVSAQNRGVNPFIETNQSPGLRRPWQPN